jgi:uncharacterized protein YbbC (DUF1343 family)
VGLVTNHTAVMPRSLEHAVDVMRASDGAVDLRAVFAPEHGFRGAAQAGESGSGARRDDADASSSVPVSVDAATGVPVYDLYGVRGPALSDVIARAGVDVIAFDVQDVGARFYTYVWTLYDVMVASASMGDAAPEIVILDRPNPLGGAVVEGPAIVDANLVGGFLARVSPIAVRHGMTVAELAWMFNREHVGGDAGKVRSVHWSPYDRVGVVNADP